MTMGTFSQTEDTKIALLKALSGSDALERVRILRDCPLIMFGPRSLLAEMHIKALIDKGANFILAVDDYIKDKSIEGIPVCSSSELIAKASALKHAVAIDFTITFHARIFFRQLAKCSGIESRDLLELLAAFDAYSVYEVVSVYRQKTLARADDWLKLADRLADGHSRKTLYATLMQRLEFNRDYLDNIILDGRDEYFGRSINTDTFSLGRREHFIDGGTHYGTVIARMLATTNYQYSAIHAFEPDRKNFAVLNKLTPIPLNNMHVHNAALSDRDEILCFNETGTMGSHISEHGDISIPCLRLDDVVEQATFIKLDIEGFEARALRGAADLINKQRPRLAIASYHYAQDLLDIIDVLDEIAPNYHFYIRQHSFYFFDTILYATPRNDWLPLSHAR